MVKFSAKTLTYLLNHLFLFTFSKSSEKKDKGQFVIHLISIFDFQESKTNALFICPDNIFFVPDKIIFVLDKITLVPDKTFLSQTKNFVLS